MSTMQKIRKPLAAFAAVTAATVAVTLPASPASAAPTTSFSYGAVAGTITWTSSHSYSVTATIYGADNIPGFYTQGQYFVGNGRYPCGSTAHRSNSSTERPRTATASTNCSIANIQVVMVVFTTKNGSYASQTYLANPRA